MLMRPFVAFQVLVAVSTLTTACAQPSGDAGDFAAVMDDFIPQAMDALDGVVPGLSIAVVQGDEVVYVRGFGAADLEQDVPATADTDFYIASSTKSFTALAAALLDLDGVIDLDAPITRYTAGVEFDPALDADHVTLRELLAHTHGFENRPISARAAFTGEHTPEVMWDLLAETSPNADAPHGTFEYTNVG